MNIPILYYLLTIFWQIQLHKLQVNVYAAH